MKKMGMKEILILMGLGLLLCQVVEGRSGLFKLKIAAFNADTFGLAKLSNTEAVSILCKIVRHYDVILIEEIHDSTGTLICNFLHKVNNCPTCAATCISSSDLPLWNKATPKYAVSVSERLGKAGYQYAFFYRTDKLKVLSMYQYTDSIEDNFEREPFSILLHSLQQGIPNFFLMGIHTNPSATALELNSLIDAYDKTSSFFGTDNGFILGDFNADCSYLPQCQYDSLDLVKDTRFTWLIDSDADTTSSYKIDCAYDRILASGDISSRVIEGSAGVFRFDKECNLTKEETKAVSNHYPVEVTLEGYQSILKVAAFNIQVFGRTKFGKSEVVSVLSRIIHRYDIILIQEIRDSSETVIYDFLEAVNSIGNNYTYAVNVSERLGRTSSKEQYAYMYRTDKVHILSVYQFNDAENVFEREPYCVLVRSICPGIPDFFLVGVHIKPSDVVAEMNALDDVYDQAALMFGTDNGVLLGDFNADCSYLSATRYSRLDLVTDTRFTWLIGSDVDTVLSQSDCSYDRIIVAGDMLDYAMNAVVFNFEVEYGLTNEEAKKVSDHYPVEMILSSE